MAQNVAVTVGAPITISPSSDNVLNLLAPYLSLNATSTGQTTLSTSLSQAIAINNGASLTLQQLAESDENLLGSGNGTTLRTTANGYSSTATFGVAANLGGGLPTQAIPTGGTVAPTQAVGGLGVVLGAAYDTGINASTTTNNGPLSSVAVLLNNAYTNFTSKDLGVAKNYFADGGANSSVTYASNNVTVTAATTFPAVAPTGYTLPTYNGLPNTTTSVYDNAYGVNNTQSGQDVFGSSRPDQVSSQIISFDPTALAQLAGNPSFPSGHATYAYTDSILLAMLVPQEYQSMLYRASAYANSRIVVGVHYPLDIIGSRSLATYDLAQAFTNPAYINNATTTGTAINLPANFTTASSQITTYLTNAATTAVCGNGSIASCATNSANTTNDPYAVSAANAATYTSNLTYGLPTLSFAQAPREQAPTGGPDASILLEPIYGGSTSAALTIATATANGGTQAAGTNGSLSTATINQIIVNTETNALAAFYGTSLSYWSRIDLASAAGYFGNVIGTLTMASTDQVTTPVTIASTGVLYANGSITMPTTVNSGGTLSGTGTVNNVTVNAGGVLAPGAATTIGSLNVNGTLTFASGSSYNVRITPTTNDSTIVTGTAALAGSVNVTPGTAFYSLQQPYTYTIINAAGGLNGAFTGASTNLAFLSASLSHDTPNQNEILTVRALPFNAVAQTVNQTNLGNALTVASQGPLSANGLTLLSNVQQLTTAQAGPVLDSLSGQGITGAQTAALQAGAAFASSISDQTAFWRSGNPNDPNGITVGGVPAGLNSYAPVTKSPIVTKDAPLPPPRTWRVWSTGFGGGVSISGNTGLGTAGETGRFYGGTLGVDYQVQPNWLVGIAAGGSNSNFNVSTLATSGHLTGFHIGAYTAVNFGDGFYGQASSTFGSYNNQTTRYVTSFAGITGGIESGAYGSTEFREHVELGRRYAFGTMGVTPYTAFEIASLHNNGFTENGTPLLGLQVNSGTTTSAPLFAGLRLDNTYSLGYGMTLTPVANVAYVHEFSPARNLTASLLSLPTASFLVNGARAGANAVQTKAGLQLNLANGVSLFANFDGEFSGVSRTYAGLGGIKVTW